MYNQQRSEKNDQHNRKTGRPQSNNQQRGSTGAYGRGSGGPAPSPSNNPSRSYWKSNNNNNGQGVQHRAPPSGTAVNSSGGQHRAPPSGTAVNSSSESHAPATLGVQNGAHVHMQPQFHGVSGAPVPVPVPVPVPAPAPASKQAEPRGFRGVSKAPPFQNAHLSSAPTTTPTATPAKNPGDSSKPLLQFGSISPGVVNGMQIPARTTSAPPNLDEQKRNQARQESFRTATAPALPTPIPKVQMSGKDQGLIDHPHVSEAHPIPKVKKDVQVSPAPPTGQSQKPSALPIGGMPMPIQYHQSQVSIQYGGHNQQMQSQGVPASSLQIQMQMPLTIGSGTQVQQPMYVPGLPHPMQHQGIMHQGPNMSFTTQLAQHPNQLISMGPQYQQQQGGKFGPPPPRKNPVKITNPKTHEELRFEKRTDGYADGGSSGVRSHSNVPPQSQTIPTYGPSHSMSFYQAPYANNMYYQNPSQLPLPGGQMPPHSQAARYTYPGNHGAQNVKIVNPSALNTLPVNKPGTHMHGILEPSNQEHSRDVQSSNSTMSSGTTHVTVKPPPGSREKGELLSNNLTTVEKVELSKSFMLPPQASSSQLSGDSDSIVSESPVVNDQSVVKVPAVPSSTAPADSVPVVANVEPRKKESLSRSNSIKVQRKPVRVGSLQSPRQVSDQPNSVPSLPSQASEIVVSESVESGATLSPPLTNEDVPKGIEESVLIDPAAALKTEVISERSGSIPSEDSGVSTAADTSVSIPSTLDDAVMLDNQLQGTSTRTEEQGGKDLSEVPYEVVSKLEVPSELISIPDVDATEEQVREEFLPGETATSIAIPLLEATSVDESEGSHSTAIDASADKVIKDLSGDKSSSMDASSNKDDGMNDVEVSVPISSISPQPSPRPLATEAAKHEARSTDSVGGGCTEDVAISGVSVPASSKDKPVPELTRSKSSVPKGKKKMKEILSKADAAGTTSDLYMAYKSPEEKKETHVASEVAESSTNSLQVETDATVEEAAPTENDAESKAEPDDWEDAADISKSNLETEYNGEQDKDTGNIVKKYSRDFLLKFAEQCTEVPENFEIATDIADVLMSSNGNPSHFNDRSPYPSPGRANATPRLDRRNSGVMEDDNKWNRVANHFTSPGRGELRMDLNFGPPNVSSFRPVPGGNYGVLRHHPRMLSPGSYTGGILLGPLQPPPGLHGGMQRNNSDADRWQRATNIQQKGLIPSPQTPLVTMHKSENRYEVGKVSDEESSKQRQLKAILNKLTPQNFDKLFEQVKVVNIDNSQTLRGVIAQIFDKALMEPTFCEMYANFCLSLSGVLPDFIEDEVKITFKRLLLNKCQEEFERGEREQEEANKADEEGEVKQSEEEREEKRIKARRRMLGNIRLIGELFKKRMLTERIMHECIKKLLGQHQTPDEEDIEALCKLMSTIGEGIDHSKAKEHMEAYFDGMRKLSINMKLSSRVRFMLKDSIDLRKNNWQQRRKVEGPKKIEEVHRDAAQEKQAQTSRLNRGPSINPTGRRGDFNSRGSTVASSPISQMGTFRPLPTQTRGLGSQDIRTQKVGGDDTAITLGPQGGLARGMSIRGPVADISSSGGDPRRFTTSLNGYSSVSDRGYSPREDPNPRLVPDRLSGQVAYDHSTPQERNIQGSRDPRNPDQIDRSLLSSPPSRGQPQSSSQSIPAEKVLSEQELREKSLTAIKEFYSARDTGEISLCVKELNTPSFHPTMISTWVTDSFEAKDTQRDLLAKLFVDLTAPDNATLSPTQLIKGFESVLEVLEDFVVDSPKAPDYMGRIFSPVVAERVVSLREIGEIMLVAGGEKPGSLLNSGLAGNILGSMLIIIKSEKGNDFLDELIKSSSLRPETFRPPGDKKSKTLDEFFSQ